MHIRVGSTIRQVVSHSQIFFSDTQSCFTFFFLLIELVSRLHFTPWIDVHEV